MKVVVQGNEIIEVGRAAPSLLEHYIDVFQAAAYLHESVRTVLSWAEAGCLPAHRLRSGARSCWKFKLSELEEWQRTFAADYAGAGPGGAGNALCRECAQVRTASSPKG